MSQVPLRSLAPVIIGLLRFQGSTETEQYPLQLAAALPGTSPEISQLLEDRARALTWIAPHLQPPSLPESIPTVALPMMESRPTTHFLFWARLRQTAQSACAGRTSA